MRPILGRIAIVIQVLIILGCKNPNNEIDKLSYNTNYQDRFELVNTKSVVIPLDSTQGFFNNSYSQFIDNSGKMIWSLLNKNTGVIHYYESEKGERLSSLKLHKEDGPNGIGFNLDLVTHLNISYDSILIYNGWTTEMILLNDRGEVMNKYLFSESEVFLNEGPFNISVTNDNRPIHIDGRVYFNLSYQPDSYANKGVTLVLDLKTGNFTTENKPSDLYLDYCWGIPYSLNILSVYNSHTKEFILSFGVDPYVYIWKENVLMTSRFVGSKYFYPKPFSEKLEDYLNKNNYQQRLDKSQLSGKYYKIIYLEHPEIYLREVFLDRTPEELASRVSGLKKTFIISDSEMNPLGEFRVPEGQYFTSNFFVSKDGIYLANYEDYLTTEDSLTFDLYEPQTIY